MTKEEILNKIENVNAYQLRDAWMHCGWVTWDDNTTEIVDRKSMFDVCKTSIIKILAEYIDTINKHGKPEEWDIKPFNIADDWWWWEDGLNCWYLTSGDAKAMKNHLANMIWARQTDHSVWFQEEGVYVLDDCEDDNNLLDYMFDFIREEFGEDSTAPEVEQAEEQQRNNN